MLLTVHLRGQVSPATDLPMTSNFLQSRYHEDCALQLSSASREVLPRCRGPCEYLCARSAAAAWGASGMGGATAPTSLVSLGRVTIDASAERVRPCSERRLCSAFCLSVATVTLCFPLDSRCKDSRSQVLCGLLLPRAAKQAGRRLLAVRSVSWPVP